MSDHKHEWQYVPNQSVGDVEKHGRKVTCKSCGTKGTMPYHRDANGRLVKGKGN